MTSGRKVPDVIMQKPLRPSLRPARVEQDHSLTATDETPYPMTSDPRSLHHGRRQDTNRLRTSASKPLHRGAHQFRGARQTELLFNVSTMGFHRTRTDMEPTGDLPGADSLADKFEDL